MAHNRLQLGACALLRRFLLAGLTAQHAGRIVDERHRLQFGVDIFLSGHIRRTRIARLHLFKDFVIAHLNEAAARLGHAPRIRMMQHLHGILSVLHFEADVEAGVRPNLVIDHAAGLLRRQNQVNAERSAHARRAFQLRHEVRLIALQLRKFIRHDEQMRQRLPHLAAVAEFVVIVDVLNLQPRKNLLSALDFRAQRIKRALNLVAVDIRDFARNMRQGVIAVAENVGHAAALVIDEDEGYLVGMIVDGQRQQHRLNKFRFARTCHARNQAVRAMELFMQIQREKFAARAHADQRADGLGGVVSAPPVGDAQLFHLAHAIQIEIRDSVRQRAVLAADILDIDAGERFAHAQHGVA